MPRSARLRPGAPASWTTDDWATPPEVIAQLEAEFGAFTLDPCARDATAKAPEYFTIEEDGLAQPWDGHVFVNPPYSDPAPWIRKAIEEAAHQQRCQVRLLLPNATDTEWFHRLVLRYCNVRFWEGRIGFIGWQGTPIGSPRSGSILASVPYRKGDRRFHL